MKKEGTSNAMKSPVDDIILDRLFELAVDDLPAFMEFVRYRHALHIIRTNKRNSKLLDLMEFVRTNHSVLAVIGMAVVCPSMLANTNPPFTAPY